MGSVPSQQVYVGLGSNLGDRAAMLAAAVAELAGLPATRVVRLSSIYRTTPWGLREQPDFYNQVAELSTGLGPHELLEAALAIEARLGRRREVRWGPRTIDIDLLLYGEVALATPQLTLPHPRMLERAFVLVPLAELAPNLTIAGRTVAEHLAALGDTSADVVRVLPAPPAP